MMAKSSPEIDLEFLSILVRGAEKIFDNAELLYQEGKILADNGSISRSLFLHQISLEECSKVDSIGAWAISLLIGENPDREKILSAFRHHVSKNRNNAYMIEATKAENDARASGDWDAALEEFKKFQEFHKKSNVAKNESLYVDWKNGEFRSPYDNITKEALTEIIIRNEQFLGYAHDNLQTLKRLEKDPSQMQSFAIEFVELAAKLRAEKPNDPMAAFNEIISGFIAKLGVDRNTK